MAKKKASSKKAKPKKTGAASLSKEQLSTLAEGLINTRGNVYSYCANVFDRKVDEDIFERLEKEENLFKCVQCDTWQHTEERDPDIEDFCQECVCKMNDEGDDE